ncbi:hypothetical protein [Nostoc sp.]
MANETVLFNITFNQDETVSYVTTNSAETKMKRSTNAIASTG